VTLRTFVAAVVVDSAALVGMGIVVVDMVAAEEPQWDIPRIAADKMAARAVDIPAVDNQDDGSDMDGRMEDEAGVVENEAGEEADSAWMMMNVSAALDAVVRDLGRGSNDPLALGVLYRRVPHPRPDSIPP
jgi:hypothetical protein